MNFLKLFSAAFASLLFAAASMAAEPRTLAEPSLAAEYSTAELSFFESKIRPVLIKHCYDCHSLKSGLAEGGLRLDDREATRAGGGRGLSVVPEHPEASLLLTAITHQDVDLKMPPEQSKLSADVLHDFRQWIKMGAPDPREASSEKADAEWSGMDTARTHWSYQSPQHSTVPEVAEPGWPRDEVDHFIRRGLTQQGLQPSSDAAPHVLLRRLYFDLVGLPPSPADLSNFLQTWDNRGADFAIAEEVDTLLESPRFGEHWGRKWLDVARFGESSGKDANNSFPFAWRYRDYVIDSVNADIPYNRFLTEQIAGDLLPSVSAAERARLLVATGFLAVGTKPLGEMSHKQFEADIIDEQIDSLTRALLASSVACARCHDHKFDPFAMQDYYALAGVFKSTKTFFGTHISPASNQGGDLIRLPRVIGDVVLHPSLPEKKFQKMQEQLVELKAERAEMDAALKAVFSGKKPKRTFTIQEALGNLWRTGGIEGEFDKLDDQGKAVPVAMGALDRETMINAHLLARGEVDRPGAEVPRAFPRAFDFQEEQTIPEDQSGRLQLAQWLTDPQHPLTSRVFVNRVWHHLFGAGLVRTVDDFGTTGETPSHPELLDNLAIKFVDGGWSLKKLVKRLVLTRTYRQASDYNESLFLEDPDNRFLWRMPKQRLSAECIRDAMLFVTDELDTSRPAASLVGRVIMDKPISLIGLDKRLPNDLDGSLNRSVYLPVIRDRLPDVLDLFDFAEPSLVTGDRETTNVPVQALYLMNSSFVLERSEAFAARLQEESDSENEIVKRAYRLCYCREPDQYELERTLYFLTSESDDPMSLDETDSPNPRLSSFCQALFSAAEFRNID